ncbi:MAG: bifunctional folylpolyglutamate synthase/dihydrofolate synthase [Phycisphaerae bacterium]|nr:bifunctional folylpolyglutamate synthase/dihydrofolate synthase [Phycisphaerae bacterium]
MAKSSSPSSRTGRKSKKVDAPARKGRSPKASQQTRANKLPAKSSRTRAQAATVLKAPRPNRAALKRASLCEAALGLKPIKTYQSALDFLALQVNYERRPPKRQARGAFTLARMSRLLKDLGHPEQKFKSVHIAGTKGKGSTAAMLSQMLANNGFKVGVYTSPHIVDLRERIAINDELIPKQTLTKLIAKVAEISREYPQSDRPTFFEILTAIAFLHFAEEQVDVAVLEVGLGGRFDATNLVKPEVCGIVNISLDHMAQLGDTVEQIAEEKAGIFKPDIPVVAAPQPSGVKKVLKRVAEQVGAKLYFAGDEIRFSYRFEASRGGPQARICVTTPTSHFDHLLVPLVGEHQAINCGVALGMLDQLKNRGFKIDDERAISGLSRVRLQGRMEMLCDQPRVLGDGAHNAASIEALMRAIGQNVPYDSMVVIFGCCSDKDIDGMLRQIQLGADKIIFTPIKSPRSADPADLAAKFAEVSGRMAQVSQSLEEALEIAEKAITREDLICITGSFYLVSQAKAIFETHPHRAMSMIVQTA